MKRNLLSVALAGVLAAAACSVTQVEAAQTSERIYGYSMVNEQERDEYRQKMRDAQSAQERQALRDEHRATMEARMRERGIEPGQMRGGGMGPRGPGAGPGAGAGAKGYGKGPGGSGKGYGKGPGPGGEGYGPGPGPGGGKGPGPQGAQPQG